MHAPFSIKKALTKTDSKLQQEWEAHVKEMQSSCLVIRRQPPQRSACPMADCQSVFEGAGSWDEWTEHVGRHMEKGEAAQMGVDRMLSQWALEEGIIERLDDGEYRLTTGIGPFSAEKETTNSNNHNNTNNTTTNNNNNDNDNSTFVAEDNKQQEDDDPSITVAITLPMVDSMDVD
jgi:hypothetical protein